MRICAGMPLLCAVGSATVLLIASSGHATVAVLQDGNSTVGFNTAATDTRVGMTSWQVDGVENLWNQWFWFRIGSQGPENRLNSLPELFSGTFNTNSDPRPDTFSANYGAANGLEIDTRFGLSGGTAGSHRSDVSEQINLINHGTQAITLHFFQYCDFDLNGSVNNDFVNIDPNSHNRADQGDSGVSLSETVLTPIPSNWEVNTFANTIARLDDVNPDNLNGNAGPLTGRADYTWAFQWDITLNPGDSFLISKDKSLTPAPGTFALLAAGGALGLRRRRR